MREYKQLIMQEDSDEYSSTLQQIMGIMDDL